MKLKDPYAKAGIPTWKKVLITIVILGGVFAALWLTNKLEFAGLKSPLPKYNTEQVVETPAGQTNQTDTVPADSAAPADSTAAPATETAA
jgi:hypothetical protein